MVNLDMKVYVDVVDCYWLELLDQSVRIPFTNFDGDRLLFNHGSLVCCLHRDAIDVFKQLFEEAKIANSKLSRITVI